MVNLDKMNLEAPFASLPVCSLTPALPLPQRGGGQGLQAVVLEDRPETRSITWELLEMSILSPTESDTWWGGVSGLCAYQAFQVILKQAQSLRTLRKVSTGHLGRIKPILALWWPFIMAA